MATIAPKSSIPTGHFDSRDLPVAERFDQWRESVAQVGEAVRSEEHGEPDFFVESSLWHLGGMVATAGRFSTQKQIRSARKARADQVDHYRVVVRLDGILESDADGQRVRVEPGEVFFTDMSRPESYVGHAGSSLILYLPREKLDEALPFPVDVHGVRPHGMSARLLADYLGSLAKRLPDLTPDDVPGVVEATVHMVAAGLAPTARTLDRASSTIENVMLRQMCQFVEMHLKEPDLSAAKICTFFKVSRASLYRLFDRYGGVAQYVKERRLLRIHEQLESATRRVHVGVLAQDHGFKSAHSFSRAFQHHFGYSASELLSAEIALPAATGRAASAEPGRHNWLTSLRG